MSPYLVVIPDSAFQLLVNNKIISLDLPVAEVYKKVWCTTNEVCAFLQGLWVDRLCCLKDWPSELLLIMALM